VTTSLAGMTWTRLGSMAGDSLARASGRPTSSRRELGWEARKAAQAGKVTAGPKSPPMQSTAIVIIPASSRWQHQD